MSVVVALGEVLLRITPAATEFWLQSPTASLRVGGAEANVLRGLSQWSHLTRLISAMPEHAIADAALRELRADGIDLNAVQRRVGRLGTYYLDPGALFRAPSVIYDRDDSVFSKLRLADVDLDSALKNATHLHVSGITPALGANSFDLTKALMQRARQLNATVSFDCNYRQALWARWQGSPASALRELIGLCDVLFAEARDIAMCFELAPVNSHGKAGFEWTRAQVFERLANCQWLAHTSRDIAQVEVQRLSSFLSARSGETAQLGPVELHSVVDRIGTGDAFVAGVLHGYLRGWSTTDSLAFGQSAFVLKHGTLGDVLRATEAEVASLAAGQGLQIRR